MAATASPYGLRPVNRTDGMPYAGATSQFLIDPAGESTNLFYGQVVIIGADGYIALSTASGADITTNNLGGDTLGAWGVFVGCSYVNAQGQQIYAQYYPSGTANTANGSPITAYVVTDPSVTFQAQMDGTIAQSALGANTFFSAVQSTSTGSTRTGNSTSAVESTVVTTAAAFKIIGFASPVTDAFPDVLIKFNPAAHAYTNNVGI